MRPRSSVMSISEKALRQSWAPFKPTCMPHSQAVAHPLRDHRVGPVGASGPYQNSATAGAACSHFGRAAVPPS